MTGRIARGPLRRPGKLPRGAAISGSLRRARAIRAESTARAAPGKSRHALIAFRRAVRRPAPKARSRRIPALLARLRIAVCHLLAAGLILRSCPVPRIPACAPDSFAWFGGALRDVVTVSTITRLTRHPPREAVGSRGSSRPHRPRRDRMRASSGGPAVCGVSATARLGREAPQAASGAAVWLNRQPNRAGSCPWASIGAKWARSRKRPIDKLMWARLPTARARRRRKPQLTSP